jgi:hypothetical protein
MSGTWVPKVNLWSSNGLNLLYTFPTVNDHNAPQSVQKSVVQTNFRSQGGIIIPGGEDLWELTIRFALTAEGYENITSAIETLESTIQLHTPYLIRIDKTQTTYFNQSEGGYKVKRTKPFEYTDRSRDLMNDIQKVVAKFDVNAW